MEPTVQHDIVFSIFLIFSGAAILATVALMARQALIIAYIVLGIVLGPSCFGLITDPDLIADMSQIGIIFLLFLLGLNLAPEKLANMFREAAVVTTISTAVFVTIGFIVAWIFRFSYLECVLIGLCACFSSTIIGLKLLPTTVLHHRHTGEIIISVLLLQDLIAIIGLLTINALGGGGNLAGAALSVFLKLPLLIACALILEKYVLLPLISRYDRIQEYVFLLTIGWCVGFAQAAHSLGLTHEIGALIAGVAIATNPVSLYIADSLRHIRDFFLVIFFFAIGAKMDLTVVSAVLLPAVCLAALMLTLKPLIYARLFRWNQEPPDVALEAGVRLGQMSEFSLLMVVMAGQVGIASMKTQSLISLATVISLIGSTTWIMFNYPSPIAVKDSLRRD